MEWLMKPKDSDLVDRIAQLKEEERVALHDFLNRDHARKTGESDADGPGLNETLDPSKLRDLA
jgi:hypothetical protein